MKIHFTHTHAMEEQEQQAETAVSKELARLRSLIQQHQHALETIQNDIREPPKPTDVEKHERTPVFTRGAEVTKEDTPELWDIAHAEMAKKEKIVRHFMEDTGVDELTAELEYLKMVDRTPRDKLGNVIPIETNIQPTDIPRDDPSMMLYPPHPDAHTPIYVRHLRPADTPLEELLKLEPPKEVLDAWNAVHAKITEDVKQTTVEKHVSENMAAVYGVPPQGADSSMMITSDAPIDKDSHVEYCTQERFEELCEWAERANATERLKMRLRQKKAERSKK